ncbi:MAG TPA: S8 family serine peptidase [Albitalea sp.]
MRYPLPTFAAVCALLLPLSAHTLDARAATPIDSAGTPRARVIVKFKSDAEVLRRHALSATAAATSGALAERARTLGQRSGLSLSSGSAVSEREQVVFASGISSAQLAARLAADSEVEYAAVDQRRRRTEVPNDPLYSFVAGNGPAAGQWYLHPPSATTPSSINAQQAWDVTPGSSGVVVAVLDTGVRFDHPDLAGKLHAGYDFITDVATANDGNGRDADASDPGDWVTHAEVGQSGGPFEDCLVEDSSWHGTQVIGLVGAATNNGVGMASVGRNVMVLPVRVLGKCGGFDSDIIAGMRWAAGLSVPGVPANPTPAKVLNLSLGGEGACTGTAYPNAINAINAAGVVIVASAGNSVGHAVSLPANCPGVIGVGGLRHAGTKVGFSDLGPQLSISAPAGNCVNIGEGEPCLYPILTTSNAGTTTPVPASAVYTDGFNNATYGTSFAAPLVAGTSALMLSTLPNLTPAEVRSVLQRTARAFPTTGGDNGIGGPPVEQCKEPQFDANNNPIDQLQCYCTTTTCGAGMLDAFAAVSVSAVLPTAALSVSAAQTTVGTPVTLDAGTSTAVEGRTLVSYEWAITAGASLATLSANTGPQVTLTPTAAGTVTVRLTVTDSAGETRSASSSITVAAAPVSRGGGGGALGVEWLALLAAAVWSLRRSGRAAA